MKPRIMGGVADEAAIERVMPTGRTCVNEIARIAGGGDYLAGGALSFADILLAPQLHYLAMTPEGETLLAGQDALRAWLDRMRSRPAMKKTMLFGI
jgi:glutathione S-transferase